VLKRLAVTPLGRPALVLAKTAGILAIEVVQVGVLTAVAVFLGWGSTGTQPLVALAAVLLGTVAFAGLGLLMAGTLRGEVTLAAANGLYLVLVLTGGMVVPLSELPSVVRTVAELLPAAALVEVLTGTLTTGGGVGTKAWIVLAAWAVAAPAAAAATFRWE
jgi:ABC-2 type transport system permease protein